jgi:hypothetical protein
MKAVNERMEGQIQNTNEKFVVLQGTLVSQMDIHQTRTKAMQEKTDPNLKETKAGREHT